MCRLTSEDVAIIRTVLMRNLVSIADARRAVEISDKLNECLDGDSGPCMGEDKEPEVQRAPMSGTPLEDLSDNED